MICGFLLYRNGIKLTTEQFVENCLLPICGEQTSQAVMCNLIYQIVSAGTNATAKNNLIQVDAAGKQFICYKDFGVYLKLYCSYCDKVCVVDVVECRGDLSQPR